MPNAGISIYLTDQEYLMYVPNKIPLHKAVRATLKRELKKIGDSDGKRTPHSK